jgi:AraC-like DNA-binding protein
VTRNRAPHGGPLRSCVDRRRDRPLGPSNDAAHLGGDGASSRFICGFLACDPQLSQGFLGGLPPLIKVNIRNDSSGQWLENSLKFSVTEAANREAGAGAMLAKLSEVALAETLRRYVRELPKEQTGWLAGARDHEVDKALTLLHQKYAHPWTVAELARLRLRLGARALVTTSHSVAQVASEVGYESEAAFNRAFKRAYGLPPARYRRDKAGPGR